jgi:hypothetical protein
MGKHWIKIDPDTSAANVLFWIINGLAIAGPWIVVIVMWIFYYSTGNIGGENSDINIWPILFFIWPIVVWKISLNQVAPEQIGAIYLLGMPLLTVHPGPYFIFPGIFFLDLDSNSNMVYLITAMNDPQLDKEFTKAEQAGFEIFRFADVTTGSKEVANSPAGDWSGFSTAQKGAVKDDPNHKQAVLRPSIVVTVRKNDYPLYRKNVLGKNADERKKELGKQLQLMTKSTVNTEFKKRTYAMLIFLQTNTDLDDKLKEDTEDLIREGGLGLKVISAKVAALGADEDVHKAVNAALAEKFNIDKKELEGEGDRLKMIKIAEGEKEKTIRASEGKKTELANIGEGKAKALKTLMDQAKAVGINPLRYAELQAEIAAFEFSKHTYLTNRQGVGANESAEYSRIAMLIVDAIKEGGKK